MKYCPQINNSLCGMTCVKNLLYIISKKEEYLHISLDENNTNSSYLQMTEFAKKYGLILEGFKTENNVDIFNTQIYPIIITINQKNVKHSVILLKHFKRLCKILDPAKGIRYIKKSKLLKSFDSYFLKIKESKETEIQKISILSNKSQIIYSLLVLLIFTILTIIMSIKNMNKISSIILLCYIFICLIPLLLFSSKTIKNIENKTFPKITSYNETLVIDRMEKFKKNIFIYPIQLLSTISLIFVLIFNNNFSYLFPRLLFIPLIISLIKQTFIKFYLNKKESSSKSIYEKYIKENKNKNISLIILLFSLIIYFLINLVLLTNYNLYDLFKNISICFLAENIFDTIFSINSIIFQFKRERFLLSNCINIE